MAYPFGVEAKTGTFPILGVTFIFVFGGVKKPLNTGST